MLESSNLRFSQSVVTIEEEYLILAEPRVSLVACEQRIPSFLHRAVRGANLCGTTRLRLAVGAGLSNQTISRRPSTRAVARAASTAPEGSAPVSQSVSVVHGRRTVLKSFVSGAVLTAMPLPVLAFADDASDLAVTSSGLAWKDLNEGSGAVPVAGSTIRCHYTGRLSENGKVFDSSYGRRPLSFTVGAGRVIAGWDLGILGDPKQDLPPMKEGGKRKLRIPAKLGYGARGAGGVIPPNADLEFEVELLAPRR